MRWRKLVACGLVLLLFGGCGAVGPEQAAPPEAAERTEKDAPEETAPEEAVPGEAPAEWQRGAPEEHGVSAEALTALCGELDGTRIYSAVIARDGVIVEEYYKDGYGAESVFPLHSCSKSVTSALVGIAIEQGYLAGVDVPIATYFPQLQEAEDGRWREITLRHLLTHTSGIGGSDAENWDAWRGSENWVEYILDLPLTAEPGEEFRYFTGNTHLLAAIVEQATGRSLLDFGREVLFDPAGMESVTCGTDPQGISDGGNGFRMNPYDMARFGQLFLNGGTWEGRQVVPADWVAASTSLQFKRSSGSADYGYQWWVRTFGEEEYSAFFAQGHAGQYIFVVPELALVVTFASDYTGSSGLYWGLMEEIVAACEP